MPFDKPQNLTGIPEMVRYADKVSEQSFGVWSLVALYAIVLLFTRRFQLTDISCAAAAGFITAISAFFLALWGVVSQEAVLITIVLVVLPIIFLYRGR